MGLADAAGGIVPKAYYYRPRLWMATHRISPITIPHRFDWAGRGRRTMPWPTGQPQWGYQAIGEEIMSRADMRRAQGLPVDADGGGKEKQEQEEPRQRRQEYYQAAAEMMEGAGCDGGEEDEEEGAWDGPPGFSGEDEEDAPPRVRRVGAREQEEEEGADPAVLAAERCVMVVGLGLSGLCGCGCDSVSMAWVRGGRMSRDASALVGRDWRAAASRPVQPLGAACTTAMCSVVQRPPGYIDPIVLIRSRNVRRGGCVPGGFLAHFDQPPKKSPRHHQCMQTNPPSPHDMTGALSCAAVASRRRSPSSWLCSGWWRC